MIHLLDDPDEDWTWRDDARLFLSWCSLCFGVLGLIALSLFFEV